MQKLNEENAKRLQKINDDNAKRMANLEDENNNKDKVSGSELLKLRTYMDQSNVAHKNNV